MDLIKEFDRADKRPAADFAIADHLAGGARRPSIVAPAPGRITWSLPVPRRGVLRVTIVALTPTPVRVRIGVSDARIYEGVAETVVTDTSNWSALAADLSAYAGWKFSLFYQPERHPWLVNVSTDAIGGVPGRVALGTPEIVTDRDGALEYAKRKRRLTRSEAP